MISYDRHTDEASIAETPPSGGVCVKLQTSSTMDIILYGMLMPIAGIILIMIWVDANHNQNDNIGG